MQQQTDTKVKKHPWTPCNTRARRLVVQHGMTYSRIAKQLQAQGVAATTFNVANVVRGFTKRPDIRHGLAALLGKDIHWLWPDHLDQQELAS